MTNNTIVYSAVTASYDMVLKPRKYTENVEYVLFSDSPKKVKGWNVLPISNVVKGGQSLTNRWYKFFPHEVFKEAEYSVYVDGNIRIIGDLEPLIQEFKESRAALGVCKHPVHTNIIQEKDACLKFGKFDERDKRLISEQLKTYTEAGFPLSQPLTENGIIFRWHRHPQLSKAMSCWWTQLQDFSKRDQISLPFVVWENDLPIKIWEWSFRQEGNAFFAIHSHRQTLIKDLMTYTGAYRNDNIWANVIYISLKIIRKLTRSTA